MIKRFCVKNFKNFKEKLIVDFTKARDYSFNQYLIKNGIINKMLIYGPNNSGKSNLGAAIMDITTHLTDNNGNENNIYLYYMNGNFTSDTIDFEYVFQFDNKEVTYSYKKNKDRILLEEELEEDGHIMFRYNYLTNKYDNYIENAKTVDLSKRNTNISALKFLYSNTMYWEDNSAVKLLMDFVNNMLWFRSLKSNEFMGVMPNGESLNDFVINNRKLKDFQKFLKDCGQNYELCETENSGKKVIGVKYSNFVADFSYVASTGTLALWLFYYWMNRTENISFIYLDEFDAFYHFELSRYILEYVNKNDKFQSVLTSHNTYLADNEIMRPDCYAELKDGELKSLADRTHKVIRQGHNLEKMMIGGEFE